MAQLFGTDGYVGIESSGNGKVIVSASRFGVRAQYIEVSIEDLEDELERIKIVQREQYGCPHCGRETGGGSQCHDCYRFALSKNEGY